MSFNANKMNFLDILYIKDNISLKSASMVNHITQQLSN